MQSKKYFECPPNHGIFVRQTQLAELKDDPKVQEAIKSPKSGIIPPSSGLSKIAGLRKPGYSSQPAQAKVCVLTKAYGERCLKYPKTKITTVKTINFFISCKLVAFSNNLKLAWMLL